MLLERLVLHVPSSSGTGCGQPHTISSHVITIPALAKCCKEYPDHFSLRGVGLGSDIGTEINRQGGHLHFGRLVTATVRVAERHDHIEVAARHKVIICISSGFLWLQD